MIRRIPNPQTFSNTALNDYHFLQLLFPQLPILYSHFARIPYLLYLY